MTKRIKVLMLNGTSMAAIQALTVLNPKYFELHLCDHNPFCWGRLHKHCEIYFRSPHFGSNPKDFIEFVLAHIKAHKYDVILQVHEEGLLLAKYKDKLKEYSNLIISDANIFNTIMNKKHCLQLAESLGIPIPKTIIANSPSEIVDVNIFPCYVKLQYGTSSSGVIRLETSKDIHSLNRFDGAQEFIVQEEVKGDLCTIQGVFKDGRLIGSHQYLAVAQGYGGGASRRASQDLPDLREYVERLGKYLEWNGALMLDFIRDKKNNVAYLIDGNPRIGETYNASSAGFNICQVLIELALDKKFITEFRGKANVLSHQMFTEVMAAIKNGASLSEKWSIAFNALLSRGKYENSIDELIHPLIDPVSFLLTIAIIIGMPMITKNIAALLNTSAVKSMAATQQTVNSILDSNWLR